MSKINSFENIIAWQKAHLLVLNIYKITECFSKKEDFCLTSQIKRAAISIPSNIAKGFKHQSNKDSIHFYNISEGLLEELKYQFVLARDLQYISCEKHEELKSQMEEVGKLINGWKRSQNFNK